MFDLVVRSFYFFFQIAKIAIVSALLCALAGAAGYTVVQRMIQKVEVPVPNLTVRRFEDAAAMLHDTGSDLSLKIEKQEYSDDLEKGSILSQTPPAGTYVKAGTVVRVVLSLGTTRIACPDLRAQPYREAGIALRNNNLVEGDKSFVYDAEAKKDLVIAQDPPPGAPLYRETPVKMLVSLGPKESRIRMPDLRNMTQLEAEDALGALGLSLGNVLRQPRPGLGDGVVLSQEPPAYAAVTPETSVSITIVDNRGL